ncbi:MAG: septal ring lytic transglycosylase RlpA family protein [Acidobacteria bacterium]|nr:septal ring lytic transglycosylase RlpA family protein [Acidobacteriota bacterium]
MTKKKVVVTIVLCFILLGCFKRLPRAPEAQKGYTEKGIASWYGDEFKGKPTASGEIFDPEKMTAAHKTLPFGTIIKVTNLDNGETAELKINDRGPFVRGRIIDCSKKGAKELGFYGAGTAKVKIEVLREGKEKIGNSPTEVIDGDKLEILDGTLTIQVGAFKDIENAKRLKETLLKKFGDAYIAKFKDFYRVRLGHFKTEKEAEILFEILQKSGYDGFITRND